MAFWTYLLHCRVGVFYAGHTDDLERRIAEHESGAIEGFTSKLLPVKLVWCGEFPTRYEALAFERRIKGWSRAKKMALIRGDWAAISALARKGDASTTPDPVRGRRERSEGPSQLLDAASLANAPI